MDPNYLEHTKNQILQDWKMSNQYLTISQIVSVDLCQLKCPEPLMMLRQAMRIAEVGQYFYVFTTDPSTERDFVSFCRFRHHLLHYTHEAPTGDAVFPKMYFFVLEKGEEA